MTTLEMKQITDPVLAAVKDFKTDAEGKFQRHQTRLDELESLMKNGSPFDRTGDSPDGSDLAKLIWDNTDFHAYAKTCKGRLGIPLELKTTITSSAVGSSTPGILTPHRVDGIVKPGVRRLRIRDLLNTFPTTDSAIEYIRENAFTNNASVQVEASDKAESALTFTIASAPVRTIAHWIPATKQILQDFARLQSYVNVRLLDGLRDEEDFELLRAAGGGVHMTGLIPSASAYNTGLNVASDNKLDTLNHALSQIEQLEYVADGIVLNPSDWRKIELLKTEEGGANKGQYLMGGPGVVAPMNVWRTSVAVTTAMPAGTFLVGDFQRAAAVYDRFDATIDISDSHSDYFIKNMVAIRAEERLALAIMNPAALVYGAFPS